MDGWKMRGWVGGRVEAGWMGFGWSDGWLMKMLVPGLTGHYSHRL